MGANKILVSQEKNNDSKKTLCILFDALQYNPIK
jgi:hypothetical protein